MHELASFILKKIVAANECQEFLEMSSFLYYYDFESLLTLLV